MKRIIPAKRHWYHYLWLYSIFFFAAGYFHIMFAWLGLVSFLLPLVFAFGFGTKGFCNRYCDRGQLLRMFGGQLGFSRGHAMPSWMKGRPFRLAFMACFFAMFFDILYTTWVVAQGAGDWQTVFAVRLYRFMLTSEIIAIVSMLWFRPRSWCVYCPMGTLTQLACQRKSRGEAVEMKGAMEK